MSRPQNDHDAVREQLLAAAEEMVRARGAISISLSEVAAACNMSQSSIYRYFPSKEAFYEAIAGRWFEEFNQIMEDVVASDLPPRDKLYAFFARRLLAKRARYEADPDLFRANLDLGEEHWEVIRGYVDLADHYMAVILGEAMAEGSFQGYELDEVVTLTNLMIQPFVNPYIMIDMMSKVTPANLQTVVDTLFEGLGAARSAAAARAQPAQLRAIS